jgi:hypothetical protein
MSRENELIVGFSSKELDLDELEVQGREIYRKNANMKSFANVANHPEFVEFFDKFFNSWEDTKLSIMLLKTASFIRNVYKTETGDEISGYKLVAMLKNALDSEQTRASIVKSILEFSKEEDGKKITE